MSRAESGAGSESQNRQRQPERSLTEFMRGNVVYRARPDGTEVRRLATTTDLSMFDGNPRIAETRRRTMHAID